MENRLYATDGYNKNGSSRPLREVNIIKKMGDYVKIEYIDTKETFTTFERLLISK